MFSDQSKPDAQDNGQQSKGILDNTETRRIISSNCFYRVMDLSTNSTEVEIKAAYLILTKRYHPDVCHYSNSKILYTKINASYTILSDKEARISYDETLRRSSSEYTRARSNDDLRDDIFESFKRRKRADDEPYSYFDDSKDTGYSDTVYNKFQTGNRYTHDFNNTAGSRERNYRTQAQGGSMSSVILIGIGVFIGGVWLLFGSKDAVERVSGKEKEYSKLENEFRRPKKDFNSIVMEALSPDGVISDSPTVTRNRLNKLKKEFDTKNIVIEVLPNKLHPRYQRLSKDPEHIKTLNRGLKTGGHNNTKANKIVKSDSIFHLDGFKRRLTLEEHSNLFKGMPMNPNVEEMGEAIKRMRGVVKNNSEVDYDDQDYELDELPKEPTETGPIDPPRIHLEFKRKKPQETIYMESDINDPKPEPKKNKTAEYKGYM